MKKGKDGNTFASLDMILDVVRMDIKSITKNKPFYGSALIDKNDQLIRFNKRTDIHQTADTVCLFFDDPTMFSPEKINKGYDYMKNMTSQDILIRHVICVINSGKGLEIKNFDF